VESVTIRRAAPGDGEGLARIWLENARYYVDLAPDDFQLPRADGLAAFFDPSPESESAARIFLVAEVDGELAGYGVGTLRPPHESADRQYVPYHAETRISLDALGVGDAYQRRGIATRLVEELEEWGRGQGATLSSTDTYVESPLSVPFWQERMGYRPRSLVLWKRLGARGGGPGRRSQ
jgi:GNAT superfamily N-acetyltransferase